MSDGKARNCDVRFLPRWQRLEKTAFWYAERAARAPSAAERDRLTVHALAAWRASRDALLRAKTQKAGRERCTPPNADQ